MGERKDYSYGQSKYLKAEELVGKTTRVVISRIEDTAFDDRGVKPVAYFEGHERGLVINASNFDILAAAISNNNKDWPGHAILLKGEKVRFKGRLVDSIVVVPKQQQPKQPPHDDPDDGIPDYAA